MATPKPSVMPKQESKWDNMSEDQVKDSGLDVVAPAKKKKPSAPVRNPAFREHEGLKALQRDLHRTKRAKK